MLFCIRHGAWWRGLSVCVALGLSGCAGNYAQKTTEMRHYYQTGQTDRALEALDDMSSRYQDRDLVLLERGNLLLSAGRPVESEAVFGSVLEPYLTERDNKPVIDMSWMPGSVMATTLGDDRSVGYRIPGFEVVMGLQYRALSFLFSGRLEGAVVEMRRAARIQESILDQYREAQPSTFQDKQMLGDRVGQVMSGLGDVLAQSKGSWNNGYVWWMSGVLREAVGEPSVAQLDYQRAVEMEPSNPVYRMDLMRLLRENDPERYQTLASSFPEAAQQAFVAAGAEADVVVVVEEQMMPLLESDTFLLYWSDMHMINFSVPMYVGRPRPATSMRLRVEEEGASSLSTGVSLFALAAHDLERRMGGILWRNILRNTSRAVANEASEEGNENWEAAIKIFTAVKGVIEEADTRGWTTLPARVQVARMGVKAGQQRLWLEGPWGSLGPFTVKLAPGETAMLYVRDVSGAQHHYLTVLDEQRPALYGSGQPVMQTASVPEIFLNNPEPNRNIGGH